MDRRPVRSRRAHKRVLIAMITVVFVATLVAVVLDINGHADNGRQMNRHILVVDNNEHMRSLLQVVLESEGYVVDTASDGLSALDKLLHQQALPAVILLDLHMPRMNGLQLIESLRQQEAACFDSIIVLSADRDALQQACRLGIRRCLEKPFDLETLLLLVSTPVV
jgi:CheY-like chemotaxis protein